MDPSVGTLTEAAATGERLRTLHTLRDRLARDIDACRSARDTSSLTSRFLEVLAQIDELDAGGRVPEKVVTPLDEFTAALLERQAAAGARRPAV